MKSFCLPLSLHVGHFNEDATTDLLCHDKDNHTIEILYTHSANGTYTFHIHTGHRPPTHQSEVERFDRSLNIELSPRVFYENINIDC